MPGPEDGDGQDSDTENVDFAIEIDPTMVAAPCPGARAVLQHGTPKHESEEPEESCCGSPVGLARTLFPYRR